MYTEFEEVYSYYLKEKVKKIDVDLFTFAMAKANQLNKRSKTPIDLNMEAARFIGFFLGHEAAKNDYWYRRIVEKEL